MTRLSRSVISGSIVRKSRRPPYGSLRPVDTNLTMICRLSQQTSGELQIALVQEAEHRVEEQLRAGVHGHVLLAGHDNNP